MSVTTVKLQLPAGKPVAPPTGSTKKPLPLDVVGIVVSWVVCETPGLKRYQPVAFCAGMLSVVVSTAPEPLSIVQPPAWELGVLRRLSGVG